ncbi:MAG: hypothetical protein GXP47_08010 [Acidobacteria bacterium]|nr:hypothetical protein [Acidobacteriota bacterium]
MRIARSQQRATEDREVNRAGREECLELTGEPFACEPAGRVVARTGRGTSETLPCELDLAQVERSHARRLFLRDRRPEVHGGRGICG